MPDTSPPVGTPPATLPCGPCAGEPTNCVVDVQTLHRQYCDLNTNYLSALQKLATLRASLSSQGMEINDLIGDIAQIEKQFDDLNGTDCSRLGVSTAPGALIVCDQGIQKLLAAPTNDGFFIQSKDQKWNISKGPVQFNAQNLISAQTAAAAYPVTLTNFPTSGRVFAILESSISNVISGQVSLLVTSTSQTLNFCRDTSGSANQGYTFPIVELTENTSFTIVKTAAAAAVVNLSLFGYLIGN